jgi:drug/metabolite transporter (DMT)-like permease
MTLSLGSSIKYIMPTALFCLLGMLLFIKAYQVAQVQLVAPTEYFSLVWGIIVGLFLFSRLPEISVIIGAIVVIASNFISGIKK